MGKNWVLQISPQQIGAFSAILMALFYALLAGFSVPTQRALIMLGAIMLAVIGQRHILPTQTLAIALLLILLYDPLAVLSPGFQLSFLAVALIFFKISGGSGVAMA